MRLRTPYDESLTAADARYLADFGIAVASSECLGIKVDEEIARVPALRLCELVGAGSKESPRASCCVLSCTSLRTLHIMAELEAEAGCPVVTSNGALARAIAGALAGHGARRTR